MSSRPGSAVYLLPLLCALLLTVQFAALQHGVKHAFHSNDASCGVYLAAERQGHALPGLSPPPPAPPVGVEITPLVPPAVVSAAPPPFQARAPPV